ncbi:OsmC family protein [Fodinibius sp.]|uniref:OsmC family protein n=1 Tax=Fodinibius sp. TaxID=1872440 RepID=UPI002ACE5DA5|nr:OsmC family protein [Fodinibius sp.]MDZ7658538.1 OsmC family protein [Fodinibius sp.]
MAKDSDKKKIVHAHLPKEETYTTTLTAGKHEFVGDEPKSVDGGKDKGPDPYDYLLMSLGSCTVMTIKMYVQHKGWDNVEDIYMELRHNKQHDEDCKNCEDPKSRIDVIEKEVIVEGEVTEEQLNKILDISQKCPVHRTLMSDIRLESSITHK